MKKKQYTPEEVDYAFGGCNECEAKSKSISALFFQTLYGEH